MAPMRARPAPGPTETEARILESALTALARLGPRKLGMRDVSNGAGVSRGTVYRYFSTKEELLGALVRYERYRYEHEFERAIAHVPRGAARVSATIEFAFAYFAEHPVGKRLLDTEPSFVLGYVREHLGGLRDVLAASLRADLAGALFVRRGLLTVEQLADLLIRLLLSLFLVPSEDAASVRDALRTMVALQYGEAG